MNLEESKKIKEELLQPEDEELFSYKRFIVDKGQSPLRIDQFIFSRMDNVSRNKIQKAIENCHILVNTKPIKANYKVRPLDDIVIYSTIEKQEFDIQPEEMPLDVVYEDNDLMVINKPAGLVVHPGSGNWNGTLLNGVAFYLKKQNPQITEDTLSRYGMVHRIDKNTSGLLLIAKTSPALQHLSKQFFHHTIQREYIALVWGGVEEDNGTIDIHVGRSKRYPKLYDTYAEGDYGKHAVTHFEVIERMHYVSLVKCHLETGRTHQIRVHMKYLGHPLFADDFYGGDRIVKGTVFTKYKQFVQNCFKICPRQALHARLLGFEHPTTGKNMLFEQPLPTDMEELLIKWRNYAKIANE
jgi:23S rRNA pseudouridine1911/1915/1917 synthase